MTYPPRVRRRRPQAYTAAQAASERSAVLHAQILELMGHKAELEDKMRRLEVGPWGVDERVWVGGFGWVGDEVRRRRGGGLASRALRPDVLGVTP